MNKVQEFAVNHGVKNVFHYGACEEHIFERVMGETRYTRKTTFFSDLSIAEWYGLESVKDTYNNVVKSWLNNVEYFTEFVMSVNHKAWEWSSRGYIELSQLYSDLYYKAHGLALDTFKGADLDYYLSVTD